MIRMNCLTPNGSLENGDLCRYKLIVRVVDDTHTTLFLLWDKESVVMLGKHAATFNRVSPSMQSKKYNYWYIK